MTETTVVIKTVGRPTLKNAIKSAKREGFKVWVISDGEKVSAQGATKLITLGKRWGFYGGMAANVGAALIPTPFITFLDDDDEFIEGAGDVLRQRLTERPEVDVWISGVRFNREITIYNTQTGEPRYTSCDLATRPEQGLSEGNVAMPTYRRDLFSKIPFVDRLPEDLQHVTDLTHVQLCAQEGYNVDWVGDVLYLVRPEKKAVEGKDSINGGGLR